MISSRRRKPCSVQSSYIKCLNETLKVADKCWKLTVCFGEHNYLFSNVTHKQSMKGQMTYSFVKCYNYKCYKRWLGLRFRLKMVDIYRKSASFCKSCTFEENRFYLLSKSVIYLEDKKIQVLFFVDKKKLTDLESELWSWENTGYIFCSISFTHTVHLFYF